jgi:class 3 adenylate cyclase
LLGLLAYHKTRLQGALKINGILCVGYLVGAWVALVQSGTYLNLVIPLFMLAVVQIPILALELWQVRSLIRWFIPSEDVERLVRSGGLATHSQSTIATVLFIDIRDYTTLSEKLGDPGLVRELVSQFHTATAALFEPLGGYVCDFQGDAQMVAFGVTPPNPAHAANAIKAADSLPEAVARLNQEIHHRYPQLHVEGTEIFRYGVGICTGDVSVGYLQGGGKLQHTVLGDTTNTAARLQGLARDLGVITVISHTTAVLAPEWAKRLRPLPPAKLKGKAEAHEIFELPPSTAN